MAALEELFNLYVFPTGRRVFAQRGVRPIAQSLGLLAVVEHVDAAVAHDLEVTLPVEHAWSRAKHAKESGDAVRIDARIDGALAAIHGAAKSLSELEGLPTAAAARAVLEAAFPAGLAAVVNQTHESQAAAVEHLLALFEGELSLAVAALGLADVVIHLRDSHAAMKALLAAEKQRGVRWSEVVDAQRKGQSLLLETVALTVAAFPRASGEEAEKRARLLAPILRQNDDIRHWRKRRAGIVDVDPRSGEVLADGPAPADTAPAGTAPAGTAPAGTADVKEPAGA